MVTRIYPYQLSYTQLNEGCTILYLNEEATEIPATGEKLPEGLRFGRKEARPGYAYTGEREDGGTAIYVADVTDDNRRAKFIAALVRKKYSADDMEAILLNGNDTPEHAAELEECQRYRRWAKDAIDDILSR
ncbi:MAG: hypothetical protein LUF04_14985 [Bacteroides sp.]|nr:hypothetical protein [Bacteroides sp.]